VSARGAADRIRARFKRAGVHASAGEIGQLSDYIGLLAKWNRTINLTALELDPVSDDAIERLILEPYLAVAAVTDIAAAHDARVTGAHLIDLGSGGGSPAIPLKIAMPALRLTMVEAKVRKSAFLREAVRQLSLVDTQVLTARLEELLARPDLHESGQLVSIRALRLDSRLWSRVSAFAAPGGLVLWFRSASRPPDSTAFFPPFHLEFTKRLVAANNSELVLLRKQR
jgi:16S rRNA (guanine527-N7)-methyltransferase